MQIADSASETAAGDARMDVATMLQMLPEKEKMVVLLFYLEELPVKEISKITGMPEGTVNPI